MSNITKVIIFFSTLFVLYFVFYQIGKRSKNRYIAFVLALFLGFVGLHQFYLGRWKKGFLYLALWFVFGVSFFLAIFDAFKLLFSKFNFEKDKQSTKRGTKNNKANTGYFKVKWFVEDAELVKKGKKVVSLSLYEEYSNVIWEQGSSFLYADESGYIEKKAFGKRMSIPYSYERSKNEFGTAISLDKNDVFIIHNSITPKLQAIRDKRAALKEEALNNERLKIEQKKREKEEKLKAEKERLKAEEKRLQKLEDECYVYIMEDTTNNYYKIGISKNPKYRERTLQSEKPTIELLAAKKYPNRRIAASFEKALHNTYSSSRERGEWFSLNEKDVKDIISVLEE